MAGHGNAQEEQSKIAALADNIVTLDIKLQRLEGEIAGANSQPDNHTGKDTDILEIKKRILSLEKSSLQFQKCIYLDWMKGELARAAKSQRGTYIHLFSFLIRVFIPSECCRDLLATLQTMLQYQMHLPDLSVSSLGTNRVPLAMLLT
jgi:hypothetical protein